MIINDLIRGRLGPKVSVGCDLGATHIKVVELRHAERSISLLSCGMIEAPVWHENNDAAIQRVRGFLKEHRILGGRAAVNIEDPTLKIRRMDLPKMPDGDTRVAIRWNFRQHIDGPIENYMVSYTTIRAPQAQAAAGKIPLMAYGISLNAVKRCQDIVKKMGMRPATIEPNATGLLAAFDSAYDCEEGKYYVILDLGHGTSNFMVVNCGDLLFSRLLSGISGEALEKQISLATGLDPQKGRTLLKMFIERSSGVNPSPSFSADVTEEMLSHVQTSIDQFMSNIVVEIQRSIDAFCLMYKVDKVDVMLVCGGGAMLPNLCPNLTMTLGVDSMLFDPFRKITREGGEALSVANAPQYALAFGLALPR